MLRTLKELLKKFGPNITGPVAVGLVTNCIYDWIKDSKKIPVEFPLPMVIENSDEGIHILKTMHRLEVESLKNKIFFLEQQLETANQKINELTSQLLHLDIEYNDLLFKIVELENKLSPYISKLYLKDISGQFDPCSKHLTKFQKLICDHQLPLPLDVWVDENCISIAQKIAESGGGF